MIKGLQYANGVVAGEIDACIYVRQACKRQLDDLKRWGFEPAGDGPYWFDQSEGGDWCLFIEQMPHIKGPLAGKNITLEPWQCFIVTTVFGWRKRVTGSRRFRRTYKEVPRGNAKTTFTAPIALKAAFADGEGGAEVYSAARVREQARAVFETAQNMARRRPEFCQALGVEVTAHAIVQDSTASKFIAVSSDAQSLDGFNIFFAAIDELHAHRTREVYDVLETGCGKRPSSMLWSITTAGSDRAGICYEIRGYAIKVLAGKHADESLFAIIYTLDDGDDWTTEASWRKANPNWNISVDPDQVAQLCGKAMQLPSAQSTFKTKHLNIWVNADQAWMDMSAWDRCADPSLSIDSFLGEQCRMALDLASKVDITARIMLFKRQIAGVWHYYAFGKYYLPDAAIEDGRNSQYWGWRQSNLITVAGEEATDFETIRADAVTESSRFTVIEIGFDPWQAHQLSQQLMADGANCIEYRNNVSTFSAPMKEIDALVRQGRLHHNGDPVLTWMISNVVCHSDAKDNIYPRKERPENKIDGVVALIMAVGLEMNDRHEKSFWE